LIQPESPVALPCVCVCYRFSFSFLLVCLFNKIGKGVVCTIEGKQIAIGNMKLMNERKILISDNQQNVLNMWESEGKTTVKINK
jgi:hypothetical protein